MKRFYLPVLLALFLLPVACGGSEAEGPPDIRYGEDVCDRCQMIISEPRFAAAYVTEDGKHHRFDDTGEMFLHAHSMQETPSTFWVHDFESEAWLDADEATFVHNPDLASPMGWGVAAFAEQADAEAYQGEAGGTVLSVQDLEAQVAEGTIRPAGMPGMSGMSGSSGRDQHPADGEEKAETGASAQN